jgi:23S rRNA (cytosine1962-C5)-methyltransferase
MSKYILLDCGDKQKLEMLGDYKVIRPCPQALWEKTKPQLWEKDVDGVFVRTGEEKGVWEWNSKNKPDPAWVVQSPDNLKWTVEPNEFGNIGIFVEHWSYVKELSEEFKKGGKVLNLFTYSGSNCVYLVKNGFKITAVDSSRAAMNSYVSNLELNGLSKEGQRMILEDCIAFMKREIRRGSKYDAIQVDPPSYGRGTKKGEVFKIEDDLVQMLLDCKELLTDNGKLCLTLHSPRFTQAILNILISQIFPDKKVSVEEIMIKAESGISLPSGFLAKVY